MQAIEKIGRFTIAMNRGALYLRWWDSDLKKTRSERLDAGTIEQARKLAKERIRILMDPSEAIQPNSGADPTFGEVWLFYEQEKRKTLSSKRFHLLMLRKEKYFKPLLWQTRMSRMSAALRKLVVNLEELDLHGNTVADIVAQVRGACSTALSHAATTVPVPVAPHIAGQTAPADRDPNSRYINFSEIGTLLNNCSREHVRDLMLLVLGTGARVGAIAQLSAHQVHFDLDVIDLLGAGIENNKRKPIVPISGPMRSVLKRRIEASSTGLLFEDEFGCGNYTQVIKRIVARSGIDANRGDGPAANWYSIRRTLADFLDERVSNATISSVLGHTSISKAERAKLFEEGSPMSMVYKRRKLAPIYDVRDVLEEEWWPQIQRHTMIALHATDA